MNNYNKWQLEEIAKAKEANLDLSLFQHEELKPYDMEAMRKALIEGAAPISISFLVCERLNNSIDSDTFINLCEKSIFIIDIDFLKEKYIKKLRKKTLDHSDKEKAKEKSVIEGLIIGDTIGGKYEGLLDMEKRKNLKIEDVKQENLFKSDDSILAEKTKEIIEKIKIGEIKGIVYETRKLKIDDFKENNTFPYLYNPFKQEYRNAVLENEDAGFGPGMYNWAKEDLEGPIGSFGNGSAIRAAVLGELFDNVEDVIEWAIASAAVTHNHPEGIKGAIVSAVAVWMGKAGYTKEEIINYVKEWYPLNKINLFCRPKLESWTMCSLRETIGMPVCQYTVPAALICVYEAKDFNEAIENALSFNNDTDTIAALAGAIAAALY